jgi:hypothetical protein
MTKLILNTNYLLQADNISCPKNIRTKFNKHYKFIKKNDNKLVFTDGKINFTLWSNHRYNQNYCCYITLEKNNKYRITKYQLNSKSVYVWIKIYQIKINYLKSYICITTLETFLFILDFYNKINIKKNLKKVPSITKVFQDNYIAQYIGEFL